MKQILSLFALSLSLLVAFGADRKTAGSVLPEFTQLYAQWDEALVKSDLAKLEKIYAPEAVLVDGAGTVTATAEFLRMVKAGEYKVTNPVTSDLSVRVYGKTAVASSIWKAVETDKDGTNLNVYRFTDTWVKTSGHWRIVASQGTKLKTP
jgi:uncharacterized protein (TIGR02246 family)